MKTLLSAAFAAAFLASSPAVKAAPLSGDCTLNGQAFRVTNGTDLVNASTSGSFGNIPQGVVNFTQRITGCVIVSYAAEIDTQGDLVVRAMLDVATGASPAMYQFTQTTASGFTTRGATFVFKTVAAGPHTVQMQYAASDGDPVTIRKQSVVVHYVK